MLARLVDLGSYRIDGSCADTYADQVKIGQAIGLTLTRDILLNHGFGFSLATHAEGWTEFAIAFRPDP